MRPGTTQLTVMPQPATSFARLFDQPATDARTAFDCPRFGIGCSTPEETTVTTRPQPLARIGGSRRPVSSKMPIAIAWYQVRQESAWASRIEPGGGPPVLLISISTPP